MEIIMSDQTKDGNMIENHLHKMVFETKINEGTGQEITLKETKQMRVSKFDERMNRTFDSVQEIMYDEKRLHAYSTNPVFL